MKYIAVDPGKEQCKFALYEESKDKTSVFGFQTKMSEGYFEDDAIEANTFIAEIDGKVYKIGAGATKKASLETSKMLDIHKFCVLTSIAMCCSSKEEEEVSVAIGMPVEEYYNIPKRNEFRDFIAPLGIHEIKMKNSSNAPIVTKRFKIVNHCVLPESIGALFLDGAIEDAEGTVGVLDLGSLNNNLSVFRNGEMDKDMYKTNEFGGSILLAGLASELSSRYSRIDTNLVLEILCKPKEERKLNSKSPTINEESKDVITNYLLDHCQKIKQDINAKGWSLDFIKLVCIGGTSSILANELREVFGNDIYIPDQPEFANVVGFLRTCYAKFGTEEKIIPMPQSMQLKTVAS